MNSPLPTFTNGVLVVPPFEAAWLTGNEYTLRTGAGCLLFEAKGDTDVTIIFKSTPGAKRLQPLQRAQADGPNGSRGSLTVEQNYTVILGSHRNSCLKFEKNGVTQQMVPDGPYSRVSKDAFTAFYVDYNKGVVTVGVGQPGDGGPYFRYAFHSCSLVLTWKWSGPTAINSPQQSSSPIARGC